MGGGPSTETKEKFIESLKKDQFKKIFLIHGDNVRLITGAPDLYAMRNDAQKDKKRNINLFDPFGVLFDKDTIDTLKNYESDHLPFYKQYRELRKIDYKPNNVHKLTAELRRRKVAHCIPTLNIDGLLVKEGIDKDYVYEIDGHFRTAVCAKCKTEEDIAYFDSIALHSDDACICKKEGCGGKIKPSIFFDGEDRDMKFNFVMILLEASDLVLSIGSDLKDSPLKNISDNKTKKGDIPLVVINPQAPSDHRKPFLHIPGDIDQICGEILNEITKK